MKAARGKKIKLQREEQRITAYSRKVCKPEQWRNSFKMLKEKKKLPQILRPEKKSFKNKGEIKIFFKQTQAEKIYYQQRCIIRKVKVIIQAEGI